ncbi:MAG: hypothetical protein ACFFDC_18570, partial [Promethearchaeota archaeon]
SDGITTVETEKLNLQIKSYGNAPNLENCRVGPDIGSLDSTFTYSVIYKDADGDLPEYVKIQIDDNSYELPLINDGNPTKGIEYSYSTKLVEGFHKFRFLTSDGMNTVTSPEFIGPAVSDQTLIRPDENTFFKISELIHGRLGKTITIDDVWLDLLNGTYVWAVNIDGYDDVIYVNRNGDALISDIDPSGFGILDPIFILAISGIAVVVLPVIVFYLRRTRHP